MYSATSYFAVPMKCPRQKPITPQKRGRKEIRAWVVVSDPSGDFFGRSFRTFDLSGAVHNYWPKGIVFENTGTKERREWSGDHFNYSFPSKKTI